MSGAPVRRVALTVNGERVERELDPRTLLVELLRDGLGLTGTHVGCDTVQCGACTVRVDGAATKACNVLAVQLDGARVDTIEGLCGPDGPLHPMQQTNIRTVRSRILDAMPTLEYSESARA